MNIIRKYVEKFISQGVNESTILISIYRKYGIAQLLDVEDMVRMQTPDWKCVFTYVQQFYRKFRSHDANKHMESKQEPRPPPKVLRLNSSEMGRL